jgi:hypothetical protein
LMVPGRRLHNLIGCSHAGCEVTTIPVFRIGGHLSSPCTTRYLSLLRQFLIFFKSEIRNRHETTDRMYIGLNNIYEYQ